MFVFSSSFQPSEAQQPTLCSPHREGVSIEPAASLDPLHLCFMNHMSFWKLFGLLQHAQISGSRTLLAASRLIYFHLFSICEV